MPVKTMTPAEAKLPDVGPKYIPSGGVPMYIGGQDKHGNEWNWNSAAAFSGMSALDLIRYNFNTTKPEVINFYLRRNVGCVAVTHDGKNYRFPGASPGIIYLPAILPIVRFLQHDILPMDMRRHPTTPGHFDMAAAFTIDLQLNPKLPDPGLYEYRQEIKGSGTVQQGSWSGGTWTPRGPLSPIPFSAYSVPGGLRTFWQEDGLATGSAVRRYGHRENGNHKSGLERDEYLPGPFNGYLYAASDRPGIRGLARVGDRVSLSMDFIGSVVQFDKPPGTPGRKIVTTVAKRTWSYTCTRTVVTDSPLRTVP